MTIRDESPTWTETSGFRKRRGLKKDSSLFPALLISSDSRRRVHLSNREDKKNISHGKKMQTRTSSLSSRRVWSKNRHNSIALKCLFFCNLWSGHVSLRFVCHVFLDRKVLSSIFLTLECLFLYLHVWEGKMPRGRSSSPSATFDIDFYYTYLQPKSLSFLIYSPTSSFSILEKRKWQQELCHVLSSMAQSQDLHSIPREGHFISCFARRHYPPRSPILVVHVCSSIHKYCHFAHFTRRALKIFCHALVLTE
jgi:hypothetical protein